MSEVPINEPTIQDTQWGLRKWGWAAIPTLFPPYDLGQREQRAGCAQPMASIGTSTTTSTLLALCSHLLTNQPMHMAKPQFQSQPGRPTV